MNKNPYIALKALKWHYNTKKKMLKRMTLIILYTFFNIQILGLENYINVHK